jgi:hypothetical protein
MERDLECGKDNAQVGVEEKGSEEVDEGHKEGQHRGHVLETDHKGKELFNRSHATLHHVVHTWAYMTINMRSQVIVRTQWNSVCAYVRVYMCKRDRERERER